MGIFLELRVGQGISVMFPEGCIDIILVGFQGGRTSREADFKVDGVPGVEEVHVSYSEGLKRINDEVYLGVRNNPRSGSGRVKIHCSTHRKIRKRDYR